MTSSPFTGLECFDLRALEHFNSLTNAGIDLPGHTARWGWFSRPRRWHSGARRLRNQASGIYPRNWIFRPPRRWLFRAHTQHF